MIKLPNLDLLAILPESIKHDEKVAAAAQAINSELTETARQAGLVLLLPRLDELPEALVDELAWQYHVDFYDSDFPLEIKRNLVRRSFLWHRKKGTPYAVKEVVSAFMDGADILENWQYGGKPYCFKVHLIEGAMPDAKTLENLYKAIMATKNTRSWLDGVEFVRRLNFNIYYGGAFLLQRKIEIYPFKYSLPAQTNNRYLTGAIQIHKEVIINA